MKTVLSFSFCMALAFPGLCQWALQGSITPSFYTRAVAWDNKVYFAGGITNLTNASNKVEIIDLATGVKETKTLPVARGAIACVAHAGKIYFAGGFKFLNASSTQAYSVVDIYDVATDTWTSRNLSVARAVGGAAALDGKIYFAGGYASVFGQSVPSNVVDIYDPANDTWSVGHLSEAKGFFQAAVAGNKLYCAGGLLNEYTASATKYIDIYDAASGLWSKDSLSVARGAASALVVGDYFVVAGGLSGALGESAVVDILNLTTGGWSTDTLSVPRADMGAAVVGSKGYFTGGGTTDIANLFFDGSYAAVDIFDAATGSVQPGPSLVQNRMEHACAAWGNKIMVGGGWRPEQSVITGAVEILTDLSVVSAPSAVGGHPVVTLFPNPATEVLHVAIPETGNPLLVRMINITGQTVLQQSFSSISTGQITLGLASLPEGIYWLECRAGDQHLGTHKVFVTKR
jgi:hypothetical protein